MQLSAFLKAQHSSCDRHFARAEAAVEAADWDKAASELAHFIESTLAHFRIEEAVLFPELEQAMGHSQGPTEVMRLEHADIRQLMQDLQSCVERRHQADFNGTADTLMIMLQQHNAKEEQVLYPMADRLLESQATSVIARCQQHGTAT